MNSDPRLSSNHQVGGLLMTKQGSYNLMRSRWFDTIRCFEDRSTNHDRRTSQDRWSRITKWSWTI